MLRLLSNMAAVIALAGCANVGAWRTLSIDGSSQAAFEESVTLMDQELPGTHRQLFLLAIVDIATTGAADPAYTHERYRSELHGLAYDEIIALADETGVPTRQRYNALRYGNRRASFQPGPTWGPGNGTPDSTSAGPIFDVNGQPFPMPGGEGWPGNAD